MAGKAFEHTARRLQLDGWVLQLINIRKQLETKLEDIPVTHLGSCGPWAPCDGACMDRAHLAGSISKVCQLESRLQILLDSHELENEIEQFIMEYDSVTNSTDVEVKLVQPTEPELAPDPELGCLPGLTEPRLVPVTEDDIKEMAAVWLEFVVKTDSIKPDN